MHLATSMSPEAIAGLPRGWKGYIGIQGSGFIRLFYRHPLDNIYTITHRCWKGWVWFEGSAQHTYQKALCDFSTESEARMKGRVFYHSEPQITHRFARFACRVLNIAFAPDCSRTPTRPLF